MTKRLSALLFLFACTSGCANLLPPSAGGLKPAEEQVTRPAGPVQSAPSNKHSAQAGDRDQIKPAPANPQPTAGKAVIALLEQAKAQASAGEGEQAAATLERALRIEPRNPWLWHRIAVLRLQQGYWEEAIDLATKSNSLAGINPRLLGGNWKVISMALEGLGDSTGAREARVKSETYFKQAGE